MKASKESSSQLCLLGDVPPSSARWGVSGVVSRASDPALVSGGSCGSASLGGARVYAGRQVRPRGGARVIRRQGPVGAVRTPGIRSWPLGFRVRLAICQCLVSSVCRFVLQVGIAH